MDKKSSRFIPELWGGVECSFNRVGELFMDQLAYADHYSRGTADIDRFASLDIKAIRYPVIWERHQPVRKKDIDWFWTTNQLERLRFHGIEPIVGLMHHGTGPSFTHLLDDRFPQLFADYARKVAETFPWISLYTPINEPLTTARFSGLYGIWHPHKRHDAAFAKILVNQLRATVLAMKEIRKVNPEARLLQTEDLSKTYSTPLLKYQADFENERRWLTFDILCGRLNNEHSLWEFFNGLGINNRTFDFFAENPCEPDIIGADHYLTSERYLDHNLQNYPHHTHGGNHRHRYADVEAIRVRHNYSYGLKMLLHECWNRYRKPLAITEVHNNGSSEDQIRWVKEVWDIAQRVHEEGVDIRAVTAWALLGSYGWNHLLTQPKGHYEVGCFDLSDEHVNETKLTGFLRQLSRDADASHEALEEKGWWQLESRCLYNVDQPVDDIRLPDDRAMLPVEEVVALKDAGT